MSLSDFLSSSKSQTLAEKVKASLKQDKGGTELVSKVRGHLESIIKYLLAKGGDISSADSSVQKVGVLETRIDEMLANPSSLPSLKLAVHQMETQVANMNNRFKRDSNYYKSVVQEFFPKD